MDDSLKKKTTELDYQDICDPDNLFSGFNKAKQGVTWKGSVIYYNYDILNNIFKISNNLKNYTYTQKKVKEFLLNERGKIRRIKPCHVSDRVVQRTLCDDILVPELSKYLIYDNAASLKNKGLKFSRDRLNLHLHNYWLNHKSNDGYILLIDFSKYFDNIRHDVLIKMVGDKIKNPEIMDLYKKIVKAFEIDVSYMNDEEYSKCMDTVFNAVDYNYKSNNKPTKVMKKSLGIGSQVSQISGIFYTTPIDNYIKIIKGVKYYGRYMDDSYVIHESKEFLEQLLKEITEICNYLGITINMKKTKIVKLSKPFKWLKITYKLKENGRILKFVNEDTIIRERRKLKKQYKKYLKGEIKIEKIYNMFKSWYNEYYKYDSKSKLFEIKKLYDELFGEATDIYLGMKDYEKHKKMSFLDYTSLLYIK